MPWLRPLPCLLAAGLLAAAAAPASAQIATSQPDLNSWNHAFQQQSTLRSLQQQNTSELNTLRMQSQRNVQYRPADIYAGPVLGRRGGFGPNGPRHQGVRAGRTRLDRSVDTGICVGC
ncbi:hypothetical protein [Methylobacterium symbioticum]|jgi:hypothetical protein|uniref:Uncharacterized protein n=1 Tax=Methylobacterium symbioticum TaxID=2584084 RepID=A0A509EKQ8_9HYPH|nr:hypothetical protein [Methylobacterium symbioticum]VUD73833.1 hypothetical protein MET9862_04453 [Methylobacterium symbioticum]